MTSAMTSGPWHIAKPRNARDLADIAGLFRTYARSLGDSVCPDDFTAGMEAFPAPYVAPHGVLYLARGDDVPVGAIAVRPLEGGLCEIKYLYVADGYRRIGVGCKLAETALQWARGAGYRTIRLEVLPHAQSAHRLVERLGFQRIAPGSANLPGEFCQFEKSI